MRIGIVTLGKVAMFLIVLFLRAPIPSEAEVFFADGFEYASQGAFEAVWATSCPGGGIAQMGPSTEFSGSPTRSLKAIQDGGLHSCFIDRSYPNTTHVFYRWNIRMPTGYDLETVCNPAGSCPGGSGSKQIYAKALGGAGYDAYMFLKPGTHQLRVAIPHNSYTRLCPNGTTDSECVMEPNMSSKAIILGTTQCIEWELDRGSPGGADGVVRVWIDGTLTVEYTNLRIAKSTEGGTAWNNVTYYSQGGYGTRYIDDLVVGNTRIGCGVTPSSGDTTAPNTPTGLSIR